MMEGDQSSQLRKIFFSVEYILLYLLFPFFFASQDLNYFRNRKGLKNAAEMWGKMHDDWEHGLLGNSDELE